MSNSSSYAGQLGYIPRPQRGPPPAIWNPRPTSFAFPPSTSLLESIFPHNPILSAIIDYLTTPALLSLYCTCHTVRYYLRGQRRYYRNLLLIPDQEAEKWDEPPETKIAVKRSAVADPAILWTMKLRDLVSKENYWIDPAERVKIVKGYIWDLVKGDPVLPLAFKTSKVDWMVWNTMQKQRHPKACFAGLMSRHLYAILTTTPVGCRLTTLVLDGTGVETDYMQHLLPQLEGTLRGLSVKGCPNIECYVWEQWLLEALQESRPVALQWLYVCLRTPPTCGYKTDHAYRYGVLETHRRPTSTPLLRRSLSSQQSHILMTLSSTVTTGIPRQVSSPAFFLWISISATPSSCYPQ